MEQITTTQIIIAILGSSLLTTVFTKVFDYYTASRKVTQILLLGAIEQLCDKIVRQGHRTKMQTQRLAEARDQYKKVKGDGYADIIIQEALNVPLDHEEI